MKKVLALSFLSLLAACSPSPGSNGGDSQGHANGPGNASVPSSSPSSNTNSAEEAKLVILRTRVYAKKLETEPKILKRGTAFTATATFTPETPKLIGYFETGLLVCFYDHEKSGDDPVYGKATPLACSRSPASYEWQVGNELKIPFTPITLDTEAPKLLAVVWNWTRSESNTGTTGSTGDIYREDIGSVRLLGATYVYKCSPSVVCGYHAE